jgi:hypothetical protein
VTEHAESNKSNVHAELAALLVQSWDSGLEWRVARFGTLYLNPMDRYQAVEIVARLDRQLQKTEDREKPSSFNT